MAGYWREPPPKPLNSQQRRNLRRYRAQLASPKPTNPLGGAASIKCARCKVPGASGAPWLFQMPFGRKGFGQLCDACKWDVAKLGGSTQSPSHGLAAQKRRAANWVGTPKPGDQEVKSNWKAWLAGHRKYGQGPLKEN